VYLSYQHKSIIVGGFIRGCFHANGTSTHGSNYIVCFKHFLIVGVCYISYGGFQTKFYKLVAIIVYARLKRKVGSLRKLRVPDHLIVDAPIWIISQSVPRYGT
jgi:hypothetical protein